MTAEITIREGDWSEFARNGNPRVSFDALAGMPGRPDGKVPSSTSAAAIVAGQVVGMLRGHRVVAEATNPSSFSFGYDDLKGRVAGYWFIEALVADGDWKDQGIEARLLGEAEGMAQRAGAVGLSTIIGSFAAELIGFFKTEGFTVRGEAEGAYSIGIGVRWLLLGRETVH